MMTRLAHTLAFWMTGALAHAVSLADPARHRAAADSADDADRGDVPGWVMITVMTAIVTIALLAVFREQVETAVRNAFESVSGAGGGKTP
jgi:Flp pilus assembly pilin Flp